MANAFDLFAIVLVLHFYAVAVAVVVVAVVGACLSAKRWKNSQHSHIRNNNKLCECLWNKSEKKIIIYHMQHVGGGKW